MQHYMYLLDYIGFTELIRKLPYLCIAFKILLKKKKLYKKYYDDVLNRIPSYFFWCRLATVTFQFYTHYIYNIYEHIKRIWNSGILGITVAYWFVLSYMTRRLQMKICTSDCSRFQLKCITRMPSCTRLLWRAVIISFAVIILLLDFNYNLVDFVKLLYAYAIVLCLYADSSFCHDVNVGKAEQ